MNIDIERVKKQYATYGKISCAMTDDLIAGFEKLQAENKQLREGQEWISVDDRLPQDNTKVLSRYEGVYDCDVVMFWRDTSNPHFGHNPATHWKPLPKPPED